MVQRSIIQDIIFTDYRILYNHCFIDHNKQLKSMTNDDCLGYLLFSQQSTRHRYNIQYTINNIQYTIYNVYRGNNNIEKI